MGKGFRYFHGGPPKTSKPMPLKQLVREYNLKVGDVVVFDHATASLERYTMRYGGTRFVIEDNPFGDITSVKSIDHERGGFSIECGHYFIYKGV